MTLKVRTASAGYKNVTLQIWGTVEGEDWQGVKIDCPGTNLRLESAVWVVQEKLGVKVEWAHGDPLLFMESRNAIRLEVGIPSPEGWDGQLVLSTVNAQGWATDTIGSLRKDFLIILDFDR